MRHRLTKQNTRVSLGYGAHSYNSGGWGKRVVNSEEPGLRIKTTSKPETSMQVLRGGELDRV